MMPGKTCGNCAAFSALTNECRRKSPSGVVIAGPNGKPVTLGIFPATEKDRWCHDWKAEEEGSLQ